MLMNNHDGTFREEALLRGVALGSGGELLGGMGVGRRRLRSRRPPRPCQDPFPDQSTGLYRNNGKGEFDDVTAKAGLSPNAASSVGERAWSISTTMAIPTF